VNVKNPQIALNGTLDAPYTISFEVKIADQSVMRTLRMSREAAQRFARRHKLVLPEIKVSNA